MLLALASSLLLSAPASPAPAGLAKEGQAIPEEMARLVPADAVLFVLLSSAVEVQETLRTVGKAFDFEEPDAGYAATALRALGYYDMGALDSERPIGVALSLGADPMAEPVSVLILPASDPERLRKSALLPSMYADAVIDGGYVAFPYGMQYERGEAPAFLGGMRSELMAARVDLPRLLQTYGPMLDMGLAFAKQMYAGMEQPDAPVKIGELMGIYLDGFAAALRSLGVLHLTLEREGSRLELRGDWGVLDGGALAGWHSAQGLELEPLMRAVRGGTSMTMVGGIQGETLARMAPTITAAMGSMYPQAKAEDYTRYMEDYVALMPVLGNAFASEVGFGAEGMQVSYRFGPEDPAAAAQALVDLLRNHATVLAAMGVRAGEPVAAALAGVAVRRMALQFDMSHLGTNPALNAATGQPGQPGPEELERIMEELYGDDLELTLGATGERSLTLFLGPASMPPAGWFDPANAVGGGAPGDLRRAVATLVDANPMMAVRFDLPVFLGLGSRAAAAGAPAVELPDFRGLDPFHLTMYGGLRAQGIRTGLALDVSQLGRFVAGITDALEAPELPAEPSAFTHRVVAVLDGIEDEAGAREAVAQLEALAEGATDEERSALDLDALNGSLRRLGERVPAAPEALTGALNELLNPDGAPASSPFEYKIF